MCINLGQCSKNLINITLSCNQQFIAGLWTRTWTWTRKNSIILPNSNLNLKKYFFWIRTRTWTRIKLFEFIRKIFKLLKRIKRSLRNIVCCSSSHNACKLKLWFYQKKSCMNLLHERNILIFLIAWAPAWKSCLDFGYSSAWTRTWTHK